MFVLPPAACLAVGALLDDQPQDAESLEVMRSGAGEQPVK